MNDKPKIRASPLPTLIMMQGLPGSGKSTLASNIEHQYRYTVHSSDKIRKELYGDESSQQDNNKVFRILHGKIKDDLLAGNNVIYDATNISKKFRRNFLSNEIKNIPCVKICLCMMTPYDVCIRQNESRERIVPPEIIMRMLMNWQPPHYRDGFDSIYYIFNEPNDLTPHGETYREKYNIGLFINKAMSFDQENRYHNLSLGEHCIKAARYIAENYPENVNLWFAALLHDIGKLYTKTRINSKGINDGNCHYYQHHSYGAYVSLLYLYYSKKFSSDDMMYISNLIYYHMHPYNEWLRSEKAFERDKKYIGEQFIDDVYRLHEADVFAH